MKKFVILLTVLICLMIAFLLFCKYADWKVEGESNIEHINIDSLNECFCYAEKYKSEKFGDKYELYEVDYKFKHNERDELTYVYTKRTGLFKNVYFVVIDRKTKELRCFAQAEANRLYGRDLHLDVEKWKFDFDVMNEISSSINYDEIEWETRYDYAISITFRKNNEIIYTVDINPFTLENLSPSNNI